MRYFQMVFCAMVLSCITPSALLAAGLEKSSSTSTKVSSDSADLEKLASQTLIEILFFLKPQKAQSFNQVCGKLSRFVTNLKKRINDKKDHPLYPILDELIGTFPNIDACKLDSNREPMKVAAENVLRLFPTLEGVTELDFQETHLSPDQFVLLAPHLPNSLSALYFHENKAGTEGIKALAGRLLQLRGLYFLKLANMEIGDQEIEMLAPALPTSLWHLELVGNKMGVKGAKALARRLPKFRSLRFLDLTDMQIGDEEIMVLVPSLPESLLRLYLDFNQIGVKGAKILAGQLPKLQSLFSLWLHANRLEDAGAKAIASTLPVSLEKLSLDTAGDTVMEELKTLAKDRPKLELDFVPKQQP